eukprot:3765038-Karenia_brevis.AAC.1
MLHAIIQEVYDNEVKETMARGLTTGYATTLRAFVDDISSTSRDMKHGCSKPRGALAAPCFMGSGGQNVRSAKGQQS